MAGTALAQGSSVTLTVAATDSILIDSNSTGTAVIEAVSGVTGAANAARLVDHRGGQAVYGPFGVGTVKLSAVGGAITYMQGTAPLTDEMGAVQYAADTSYKAIGLVGPQREFIPLFAEPKRYIGASLEQPGDMTRPVTSYGKLACRFGSGQWTASSGSPTLTQGYTGWDGSGAKTGVTSRTGQPDMLKVVPAADTTEQITLGTFSTNMLTKSLGGKLGIWVYVQSQPGYQVGGTVAGSIFAEFSNTGATTNGMSVYWNTNQIREGWNFLVFVMRTPAAYVQGNSDVEYHPFGITASRYGTGATTDIVNSDIGVLRLGWVSMLGATLYFDSIWTGFSATPQIVWGNDAGSNLLELAAPVFDNYGWVGYTAHPFASGGTHAVIADLTTNVATTGAALYARGWDFINHTANHPQLGALSAESQIVYEMETARGWQYALGLTRGAEFYASPQSSSSRLSEGVISGMGFKLQRHARHWNVHVTPFGIDNPGFVGAIDIGHASATGVSSVTGGTSGSIAGFQTATKIKRAVDVAVAYQCALFPYWHGVTQSGDTGTGEDATGDNLLLTYSAFRSVCAYVRQLELAGSLQVCRGMTGFYYGG